jgi:LuxR family transcriptional regulator, maltose regulon positive regulatory protein
VPQLHRRAAAWCEEHGLADDAIRHALAAEEMTWAARLVERYFDEFYFLRGEAVTIQHWLSALPADLVRSRARLLLARTIMAATGGQPEAVEPLLDAAERVPRRLDERTVRAYRRPGRQQAGEPAGADDVAPELSG